jgi:transcriptional regulator with XRE-family HTH domain
VKKKHIESAKNSMDLGKRMFQIREILGLKGKEMASNLNVSPAHISNIEKRGAIPSVELLLYLGELSMPDRRINLDWVLSGKGEPFIIEEASTGNLALARKVYSLSPEIQQIISQLIDHLIK